jgi:hypothetical protein
MPPDAVVATLQPWADVYAESRWLPLVLLTAHVLSLVVAAGVALAVDRRVLRATPTSVDSSTPTTVALLDELSDAHPLVMRALAITLVSGAAMATADVGTYASSAVFWSKMGLVALLLLNGQLMRRAERQLAAESSNISALRASALRSGLLWGGIIVLGVVVSNQ